MKLANGSGSIVKLGGNRRKPYAVRITEGWKDGKQVRKYIGYYEDQPSALQALAEYHKTGYDVDLSKLTLQEVFDRWIVKIEAKNLSSTVVKGHLMASKRFGWLGKKQFKTLKTDHLQDWLNGLDLKPGSKRKVKQTMNQLYEYAITNDIVNKNYASSLEVNGKIEKTGSPFTPEELNVLWEHSDHDYIQDILILVYTGARIGELLEITKEDIHFDEGYMIGGNKTEAGRNRVIPIHNRVMPFIKQKTENSRYIVHMKRGTPIEYPAAKQRFERIMKKFGWEHKLHDTRKTAVSLMHSAGIPMETIRKMVGHSNKGVTESVYLYKTPKELVEAINKIEVPY